MTAPRRALILIDIQNDYFSGPLEIHHPAAEAALARITSAIDTATEVGMPIAVVQHAIGEGAPVFDPTTPAFELHPEIEGRRTGSWKQIVKKHSSVFVDTELMAWLREDDIDTVTFTGFMTNNCVLASSVDTESLGLAAEVLSDATGAISIANDAGFASAKTVHETLMALLNSNWAAVGTTADWSEAVAAGAALTRSDFVSSAVAGAEQSAQVS